MKKIFVLATIAVLITQVSCVTYNDDDRMRTADFEAFESWHKVNAETLTGTSKGQLQGKHLEDRGYRELYVNEVGRPAFAGDGIVPLPEGTIIVKDTYYIARDGSRGRRWNITIMKKREAGYDPDNNDWEYATAGPRKFIRYQGTMSLCVDCHVVAERDYVFTWE